MASKRRSDTPARRSPASRRWVAPTFVAAFVLGALWLIVYYIVSYYPEASAVLSFMMQLGNWNILIGMGLMAISFIVATQWK
ncbi:MAG TPA: cell division protein CrgA [Candidatus Avipropionibacterium avicola]|uniref:Cell division protein CrgA n=1 Tax=Candidatus Avipropionibacterium avicola TaxID=2840701 RepID=A0A9D1GYD6_9ACTN|nr:cell division protein CrgA [Candidatus Avipropionibacterium avicola]